MAKSLKDILNGKKSSVTVDGSTGTDPAVDYKAKSKGEQDFVAKHKTEKHSDRVGNEDDVYKGKTKEAKFPKQKESAYEAASCNMTEMDKSCPVHGMKKCPAKLQEILTKDTPASEYIKDFEKSKNPKFAGKSKEERKKQALAAYYSKKNEEVEHILEKIKKIKSKKKMEDEMDTPMTFPAMNDDNAAHNV